MSERFAYGTSIHTDLTPQLISQKFSGFRNAMYQSPFQKVRWVMWIDGDPQEPMIMLHRTLFNELRDQLKDELPKLSYY